MTLSTLFFLDSTTRASERMCFSPSIHLRPHFEHDIKLRNENILNQHTMVLCPHQACKESFTATAVLRWIRLFFDQLHHDSN